MGALVFDYNCTPVVDIEIETTFIIQRSQNAFPFLLSIANSFCKVCKLLWHMAFEMIITGAEKAAQQSWRRRRGMSDILHSRPTHSAVHEIFLLDSLPAASSPKPSGTSRLYFCCNFPTVFRTTTIFCIRPKNHSFVTYHA